MNNDTLQMPMLSDQRASYPAQQAPYMTRVATTDRPEPDAMQAMFGNRRLAEYEMDEPMHMYLESLCRYLQQSCHTPDAIEACANADPKEWLRILFLQRVVRGFSASFRIDRLRISSDNYNWYRHERPHTDNDGNERIEVWLHYDFMRVDDRARYTRAIHAKGEPREFVERLCDLLFEALPVCKVYDPTRTILVQVQEFGMIERIENWWKSSDRVPRIQSLGASVSFTFTPVDWTTIDADVTMTDKVALDILLSPRGIKDLERHWQETYDMEKRHNLTRKTWHLSLRALEHLLPEPFREFVRPFTDELRHLLEHATTFAKYNNITLERNLQLRQEIQKLGNI